MSSNSLTEGLVYEIRRSLAKSEQVSLFLNRCGFAPTLIRHGCGWVARCKRCAANLIIHFDPQRLRRHHCAQKQCWIKQ
ncbi:MAG: hypothetical protein QX188_08445 [Methylococcaceae bacterium]